MMTTSFTQADAGGPVKRLALAREALGMAYAVAVYPLGFSRVPRPAAAEPANAGPWSATPVVLVHGYLGNRSSWFPLERSLAVAGVGNVHAASYDAMASDLPAMASQLVTTCRQAIAESGADKVHVVGHSLGGLVLRYALHVLGLAEHVGTAVTVASPHRGAPVARFGRGAVVTALRPSSRLLAQLDAACRPDGVRWVAYYSNTDVIVPPRSARLTHPALQVENRLVPDQGHISILRSNVLLNSIPQLLLQPRPATPQPDATPAPLGMHPVHASPCAPNAMTG